MIDQCHHLDSASILANVEALLPEIDRRRPETAQGRRLPADLVVSLKAAGVFRIAMPAAWGGPEMSMPDQLHLFERLAHADPAVGWTVMIGCDGGYYSSFLDDDAGRTLWPDLDMATAGWMAPAGHARRVGGGLVVDGRWRFGSGCTHADVIVGGCLVVAGAGGFELGPDGSPAMRVIAAPAAEFEIIDTWHTTGLAGSGSNDYACHDLFVPDAHTFALSDPVRRPGPLYRFPGAFATKFHGAVLGLARRALDEIIAMSPHRIAAPPTTTMRELPRVHGQLGAAERELRAVRAYSFHAVTSMWEALVADQPLTDDIRADMTLSRVEAADAARSVALQAVRLAGTDGIFTTSVLDQLLRDAITIGQHVAVGPLADELAGALLLGIQPTGPLAAIF